MVSSAVTIYPSTNLAKELRDEQFERVMEWFRSNGVDPRGVPRGHPVVIDLMIDFWWWTKPEISEPEGAHSLERTFTSDEYPLSHLQVPVKNPLPEDLETALRALQAKWDDLEHKVPR